MSALRYLLFALCCLTATSALGAPLGLRMTTNATTLRQGDVFQLDIVLTVNGQDAVDELDMPDLDDFDIVQQSESQGASINIVGGRRTVLVEHRRTLALRATTPGTKQIGEATARLDGNIARAAPITIRVVPSKDAKDATPPTASAPPVDATAPTKTEPTEPTDAAATTTADPMAEPGARFGDELPRIFAELRPDTSSAFVGQQITLLGEVYSQVPLGQYPRVPGQKPPGFVCLPLDDGQRLQASQRVLRGRSFYVYPVSRDAIFARAPGKVTLAPLQLEVTPSGSFFSRSQDVRLSSAPVVLDIKPLPEPSPPDFAADNVGRVELRASVRPTAVKAGEPFTLAVEVVGWGNPDAFVVPRWGGDGDARVFPSTSRRERRDQDGVVAGRVLEETLIQPQRPGRITIPSLTLVVFDPTEARYVTRTTAPLAVVVGGDAGAITTPSGPRKQQIANGARPLALDIALRAEDRFSFAPMGGAIVAMAGGVAGLFGRRRRRRLESEAGQRRRRVAARVAAAEAARSSVDVGAAHRLLLDALAERCGEDVRSAQAAALPDVLVARGVGAGLAARVADSIVAGEAARFAPGGQKGEAVTALLACVADIDGGAP